MTPVHRINFVISVASVQPGTPLQVWTTNTTWNEYTVTYSTSPSGNISEVCAFIEVISWHRPWILVDVCVISYHFSTFCLVYRVCNLLSTWQVLGKLWMSPHLSHRYVIFIYIHIYLYLLKNTIPTPALFPSLPSSACHFVGSPPASRTVKLGPLHYLRKPNFLCFQRMWLCQHPLHRYSM